MSKSKSKSKSTQTSFSQDYGSRLNADQGAQLSNLWSQGANLNASGAGQAQGYQGYNQAMGMNQLAGNQLGGAAMQGAQDTFSRLQNPGMDPMMGVYAKQIGQNFNEQIMPGLRGDAMVGGGLGSSRAGIAQGLAGARAGQQLQDFGAQLYGQNQDRALQAAGAGGNLAGSIADAYGNLGQNAMATGQFGMGIPWYGATQQKGLLGAPIVENLGGYSTSTGTSKSKGSSIGL